MTTRATYQGDGLTRLFTIPCPYLDPKHIKARVNQIGQIYQVNYQTRGGSVAFRRSPPVGAAIEIYRETPIDTALTTFHNGAVLGETELNLAVLQNLYAIQELTDNYNQKLNDAAVSLATGNGLTIVDPHAILQELIQSVLESELLGDLQAGLVALPVLTSNIAANTSAINSLQDQIDGLVEFDPSAIEAAIIAETDARVVGDTALASDILLLGAHNADNTAFILNTATVRVDSTTSLATRLSGLDSSVAGNTAAIASEAATRATADSALSTSVSAVSAIANARNTTFRQSTAPTANAVGDLWFDTGDSNKAYRWNGTSWVATDDTRIATNTAAISTEATARASADSALSSSITTVSAIANARNTIFRQAAAPTANAIGDLWFDSDDSNKAYRWDGSSWTATADTRIDANAAAITTEATARASADSSLASSISTVSAIANSRNTTFRQASAPTANATGDLWFDSDDSNKAYRWNGTSWVATDDARIDANSAAISTEATARASADSALSSSLTTLSTTVSGHTATIATQATSISGIEAKYTVKIDNNGYVTGYGLISTANNGTPTSEFIVLVDKFAIVTPGKTAQVPFVVGNIGGVSSVGITGALIVDGTIVANAIAANAITAAKIAAGVITASHIAAGSITADRLDTRNLTVKDGSGAVIFSSGVPLTSAYITPASGWVNSNITISGGAISGIGTGNGTSVANSSISISSGAISGIGTGNGTAVANSAISINSNGTLSGAGGGAVSLGGLGAGAMALINSITSSNISTYIASAAIGGAYIANAAIVSAHIGSAQITSAHIANLSVGTAHIADLSVGTIKIANGAVTTKFSTSAHDGQFSSGFTNAISLTFTTSGGPLTVLWGCPGYSQPSPAGIFLYRDSSVLLDTGFDFSSDGTNYLCGGGVACYNETLPAGTYTYGIYVGGGLLYNTRSITVLETKK